jgi:hypothetical protein
VSANHTRPIEDLHDCFALFSSRARNSLDYELWWSGDVDAVQQIPQSTSGDRTFIFGGLDLIGIVIHLLIFGITQGCVVLIIFVFIPIAFFFSNLVVFFFLLMIIVIVLRYLLSFFHRFLSFLSRRYHDHIEESQAVTPAEVAHPLAPFDKRADV